jgi:hypothetical protein
MTGETPWQPLDVLSAAARSVAQWNAEPAYSQLVVRAGPGPEVRSMLNRIRPEGVLARPARSTDDARGLLAGLWLWHDALDESHAISQALPSATGSFWHAIMHRREGDFSNAKYWYARCRHHPALAQVPALARATLGPAATSTAPLHGLVAGEWDPDAFADVVEAVHRKPDDPLHGVAIQLQRVEWQALFAHCAKQASGG